MFSYAFELWFSDSLVSRLFLMSSYKCNIYWYSVACKLSVRLQEEKAAAKRTRLFFRLSPSDYLGLHQRYARLLGDDPQTLSLSKEQEQVRKQLSELSDGMMHTLYS